MAPAAGAAGLRQLLKATVVVPSAASTVHVIDAGNVLRLRGGPPTAANTDQAVSGSEPDAARAVRGGPAALIAGRRHARRVRPAGMFRPAAAAATNSGLETADVEGDRTTAELLAENASLKAQLQGLEKTSHETDEILTAIVSDPSSSVEGLTPLLPLLT